MHHLFGRKIILFLIFCFCISLEVSAQNYSAGNYNYKSFKRKNYYFGLSLGPNTTGYRLNQSSFFIGNEEISIAEPESGLGLNLNMVANIKLGDFFDFRFTPGFAFTDRKLEFTRVETGTLNINSSEAVFFELPFMIRYKSKPYKDKRVFFIGGLKYSYDVASDSESKQSILRFSPHDFQWEVGLGMQFFYPYFIFSPELKFSRGITNTLIYDNALNEAMVLENVFSQTITLSFNFEG